MRIAALLLICAVTVGCVTLTEDQKISNPLEDLVLSSPRGATPDFDVLALPDVGYALVSERTSRRMHPTVRLRVLKGLFDEGQPLAMRYDAGTTLSVSEAFDQRVGNCLTFTQIFVALAREAGLEAYFEEVAVPFTWEQMGAAVTLNRHIAVYGRIAGGSYEVDFGHLVAGFKIYEKLIVSDRRARAQFFNNLGAEAIARGEFELAIRHFNRSLMLEPYLAFVWSNLGVALMQVGEVDDAERSYLWALQVDRYDLSAMSNLVLLYDRTDRSELADGFRQRVARYRARNPYDEYLKGEEALSDERFDEAVTHLRQAVRDKPDDVRFRVALARAYRGLGKEQLARASIRKARQLSKEQEKVRDVSVYE
jgi:Flp pilus assembly protein TadD